MMYTDPSGHSQNCGPDGVLCDDDPSNDDEFDLPDQTDPFFISYEDYLRAMKAGYGASLSRGLEFVNGLRTHKGWWTEYLESGDFDTVWKFLLAFSYLWESYSYKGYADWSTFQEYMTESIINKAGEFYKDYGVVGFLIYLGGREALYWARGGLSDNDPRWQEGTGEYFNTWDLTYLGVSGVWADAKSDINSSWFAIINWQQTVGNGAWDYGVSPPLIVDETKIIWQTTITDTVNPWTGNEEPYIIYFRRK